jgi:hypothetical protein
MFTMGIARREIRVRCDYSGPVDHHGLRPHDEKVRLGVEMHKICHCEEDRMDDAAIHHVTGEGGRLVSALLGSQWIAMGFQPSR